MIDDSEKRNRQLAVELQNSHICEKRSKCGGPANGECLTHDMHFNTSELRESPAVWIN